MDGSRNVWMGLGAKSRRWWYWVKKGWFRLCGRRHLLSTLYPAPRTERRRQRTHTCTWSARSPTSLCCHADSPVSHSAISFNLGVYGPGDEWCIAVDPIHGLLPAVSLSTVALEQFRPDLVTGCYNNTHSTGTIQARDRIGSGYPPL